MKTGLRIFILLMIIIASGIMMYMPYVEIKQKTITSLNEKQMLIAKQAASGIESFFREQGNMLHHFATHPNFIDFNDDGKASMERSFKTFSPHIKAITRYDNRGIIIYSYPEPEKVIGKDISAQPHVQKILRDHKPDVSDVFMSIQGFQSVALSEPVFKDGEFVGVVAFLIDFAYIAKTFLEDIKIGANGYAWMISRDGTELYCPVPGHTGVNVAVTSAAFPSVLEMADRMKKGLTGVTTYTYDMVKGSKTEVVTKHAVYYPISILDNLWSITVATPETEVYSELSDFYHKMIISMVMFVLSVLLFVYVMINDYNLAKLNRELELRVQSEMDKRKTQEKLMLQQARFYSMGETMNAIAHQWRQPLNAVGLCIQDMEDAYKLKQMDDKYMSEMVRLAMGNLNRLSETIDDFRDFFAPSEELSRMNICTVVLSTYNIVKVQYEQKNINLRFLADGVPVLSSGDCAEKHFTADIFPDMLKQVLLNCLQNSKEAIERCLADGRIKEGLIAIFLSRDNGDFVVEITDNGGGVPEKLLDRVFDPYFTTKDISIGMGLGLYIAKNIMEEHMRGSITIENKDGGARTVLRFKA